MKNLAYISTLIFALVLMNTSCTKPTDDGTDGIKSSGDLYPAYVGTWKNDSTYKSGVKNITVAQYGFKIEKVTATKTNSSDRVYEYWNVITGKLNLIGSKNIANPVIADESFDVTSAPAANKMVLTQGVYKYFLSK